MAICAIIKPHVVGKKGDSQKNFGFFNLMAPKMRERKRKKNLSEAADN